MTFKPSELPLLVSLDILLQERNVTRAAARLHLSQPALSAQLARLRRLFKDPLLVPSETGRGMVPTPKAEDIAQSLRDALVRLDAISHPAGVFDPRADAATFRIRGSYGAIGSFSPALFAGMTTFRNRALRMAFQVDDEHSDVLAPFESGDVDLVLLPAERIPASLKMRALISEPYVVVQRRHHPRGCDAMSLDDYCQLGHVIVSPSGRLHGSMDRHLKALGRAREVVACAANGDALGGILACTDLICTLPRSMAESIGSGFECHALPFDVPPVTLAMAWHARLDKQPAHRWLREQLVRIARLPLPSPNRSSTATEAWHA